MEGDDDDGMTNMVESVSSMSSFAADSDEENYMKIVKDQLAKDGVNLNEKEIRKVAQNVRKKFEADSNSSEEHQFAGD